jgi:hypothetical protein
MRRNRPVPLSDSRRPHWLTVSDPHRNLITCTVVPEGTDLRATMRDALTAQAAAGWQPENDSAYGFVFIAKGSERRLINLTPADPSQDFNRR